MTSLFPPSESLVSDIPSGDGNIEKLFLRCSKEQGVSGSMTRGCIQRETRGMGTYTGAGAITLSIKLTPKSSFPPKLHRERGGVGKDSPIG
jgi:hypothetical protein